MEQTAQKTGNFPLQHTRDTQNHVFRVTGLQLGLEQEKKFRTVYNQLSKTLVHLQQNITF